MQANTSVTTPGHISVGTFVTTSIGMVIGFLVAAAFILLCACWKTIKRCGIVALRLLFRGIKISAQFVFRGTLWLICRAAERATKSKLVPLDMLQTVQQGVSQTSVGDTTDHTAVVADVPQKVHVLSENSAREMVDVETIWEMRLPKKSLVRFYRFADRVERLYIRPIQGRPGKTKSIPLKPLTFFDRDLLQAKTRQEIDELLANDKPEADVRSRVENRPAEKLVQMEPAQMHGERHTEMYEQIVELDDLIPDHGDIPDWNRDSEPELLPATPKKTPVTGKSEVRTGRLITSRWVPNPFGEREGNIYCVTFNDDALMGAEEKIYGNDLERALKEVGARPGQMIKIENLGTKDVHRTSGKNSGKPVKFKRFNVQLIS